MCIFTPHIIIKRWDGGASVRAVPTNLRAFFVADEHLWVKQAGDNWMRSDQDLTWMENENDFYMQTKMKKYEKGSEE